MIIRAILGIAVGLFTQLPSARADDPIVVKVTPENLLRGAIDAPPKAKDVVVNDECKLVAEAGKWTFKPADCKPLLLTTTSYSLSPEYTLLIEPSSVQKATFKVEDRIVVLATDPALQGVIIPGREGWAAYGVDDGRVGSADVREFLERTTDNVWGYTVDKKTVKLDLAAEVDGAGSRQNGTANKKGGTKRGKRKSPTWCARPLGMEKHILVCLDASAARFDPVYFEPKNHIIGPNRSVVVVVLHDVDHGVEIAMEGDRGIFEPTVANLTGGLLDPAQEGKGQQSGGRTLVTTTGSFAPRTPGDADLRISLYTDGDDDADAEHTVELIVEGTYLGAIRLGFATILGGAVDRAYTSQEAPGSSTSEVAVSETGNVNIELTVGLSAYLADIIEHGGRRYVDRRWWSYLIPSPYVGVGVVTPTTDGVRVIPSLHLGAEWEISKSFAISLNAVARQVTRLADGFSVGSPVSEMTSFTEERYEWGWAFVVSVSPEFLQLATGKP